MYEQTAYDGASAGRDRITQALMGVQNPPPVANVPQMPPPPMPGGAAGGGPGAPGGAITPAAAGMPGASMPGMGQQMLSAATPPGMQPGGLLAPQMPGAAPQPMPPRY
jgi:hypothetical protein